jgi:Uma2 family endonuclease
MALVRVAQRVTYTDLQSWPDDGRRHELYDGEVWVIPSPLLMHQDAAQTLFVLLRDYAQRHGGKAIIAPIDIVFDELNVLQPDVVFFNADRKHFLKRDLPIRIAPDLVVEVLSSGTARNDRGRKRQAFARFGVPEYWMADPVGRTIDVWRLTAGTYELHAHAGPGGHVRAAALRELEFDVDPIFAE